MATLNLYHTNLEVDEFNTFEVVNYNITKSLYGIDQITLEIKKDEELKFYENNYVYGVLIRDNDFYYFVIKNIEYDKNKYKIIGNSLDSILNKEIRLDFSQNNNASLTFKYLIEKVIQTVKESDSSFEELLVTPYFKKLVDFEIDVKELGDFIGRCFVTNALKFLKTYLIYYEIKLETSIDFSKYDIRFDFSKIEKVSDGLVPVIKQKSFKYTPKIINHTVASIKYATKRERLKLTEIQPPSDLSIVKYKFINQEFIFDSTIYKKGDIILVKKTEPEVELATWIMSNPICQQRNIPCDTFETRSIRISRQLNIPGGLSIQEYYRRAREAAKNIRMTKEEAQSIIADLKERRNIGKDFKGIAMVRDVGSEYLIAGAGPEEYPSDYFALYKVKEKTTSEKYYRVENEIFYVPRPELPEFHYFLTRDNKIIQKNAESYVSNLKYPLKTKIFESDYLYESQINAVYELVKNKSSYYVEINDEDLIKKANIGDLFTFQSSNQDAPYDLPVVQIDYLYEKSREKKKVICGNLETKLTDIIGDNNQIIKKSDIITASGGETNQEEIWGEF